MTAEAEHGQTLRGAPSAADQKPSIKLQSTAATWPVAPVFKQPQPGVDLDVVLAYSTSIGALASA